MGTVYYAVERDAMLGRSIVIFGSEEEIEKGTLEGGFLHESGSSLPQLADDLQDSGSSCEDYVLVVGKYLEESQIPKLKEIVERYGFVENNKLLDCGWG